MVILLRPLKMKGLLPKWISWVQFSVFGSSVAIKINDDVGSHTQTNKRFLKQGDPLSQYFSTS
jgi:hypothetical protein